MRRSRAGTNGSDSPPSSRRTPGPITTAFRNSSRAAAPPAISANAWGYGSRREPVIGPATAGPVGRDDERFFSMPQNCPLASTSAGSAMGPWRLSHLRQVGWADQAKIQLCSQRRLQPSRRVRGIAAWDTALCRLVRFVSESMESSQGIHGDRWRTAHQHRMDRDPRSAAGDIPDSETAIDAAAAESAVVMG